MLKFIQNVIKILLWKNILVYALSFYISLIMNNFFDSFVKDVFIPSIYKIFPLQILDQAEYNFKNFFKETINLSIACYITYISIKFVKLNEN